ncbi:MAG TPA: TIGR03905 family TSCPD domain-containing protein [Candidatus Scatosoma pullistercoris]|uniref:ribonucleoside-diphosphate reductase n=1 Tax=Candidatus Scatosoma pullistercoris TaxID=2840934 RepID=A0A9D1MF06_9FIRM|nr:TIGR03905 family TSCPD domain-containing protein [Candidatus Scatosoma pullistercoris]
MFTYSTKGTCSRQILFNVDADNKLRDVRFIGGCGGNLQGISRLVEGKNIDEIESLLKGIRCRNGTSCPDQLSKAIAEYKAQKNAATPAPETP